MRILSRFDSDRSRTVILLVALIALAMTLDLWQVSARRRGGTAWFETVVCGISAPMQQVIAGMTRSAERGLQAAHGAREFAREDAQLRARIAELEGRLSHRTEDSLASRRAVELLSSPRQGSWRKIARIIGLGDSVASQVITVDRGQADGVRPRDIATTAQGLVGQVVSVTAGTARIVTLTDPTSAVAVRLQRSREAGILKGLGGWRCEVRYLDPQADVQDGDTVITSGLGGIFSAGLRVGTVTKVSKDPETPGKAAEVRLSVQLRKIEEVLLLRTR